MKSVALVTGGAGFIGSHIVDALLGQGTRVRVLDNLTTGSFDNLCHRADELEFIPGDIRDPDTCYRACQAVDTVFHQAAVPSVPRSIADPLTSHAVDVTGTLQMLMAARDQGVRRFVFASSSAIYGDNPVPGKREDLAPSPLSPYAINKLTGEQYCRAFHSLYGLETVCLRYFNVFGPRQLPNSAYAAVIPRFVDASLKGEPVTIYGDGSQSRDFVYVANVVQANLLASWVPGVAGSVFNVGCGTSQTLNELCRGIAAASGWPLQVEYSPARDGDILHSMADISAARALLRYEPAICLAEGLDRTVRWAVQQTIERMELATCRAEMSSARR